MKITRKHTKVAKKTLLVLAIGVGALYAVGGIVLALNTRPKAKDNQQPKSAAIVAVDHTAGSHKSSQPLTSNKSISTPKPPPTPVKTDCSRIAGVAASGLYYALSLDTRSAEFYIPSGDSVYNYEYNKLAKQSYADYVTTIKKAGCQPVLTKAILHLQYPATAP